MSHFGPSGRRNMSEHGNAPGPQMLDSERTNQFVRELRIPGPFTTLQVRSQTHHTCLMFFWGCSYLRLFADNLHCYSSAYFRIFDRNSPDAINCCSYLLYLYAWVGGCQDDNLRKKVKDLEQFRQNLSIDHQKTISLYQILLVG